MESTTTTERPYDYAVIYKRVCAEQGRDRMSDKDVGARLGVSERQIRKARMEGMDSWMADLFATRAKVDPWRAYGWDEWFTPESFFAADLAEGVITKDDVAPLFRSRAWEQVGQDAD